MSYNDGEEGVCQMFGDMGLASGCYHANYALLKDTKTVKRANIATSVGAKSKRQSKSINKGATHYAADSF